MIREVKATDHLDSITALAAENWQETGFDFELKPSRALYKALEDCGALVCLAAFDEDEIVGYVTGTISGHIFNDSIKVCATDALFVKHTHRDGTIPGRLILETERLAKSKGARLMIWQTRAGTGLATTLMKRGYRESDLAVMKEI